MTIQSIHFFARSFLFAQVCTCNKAIDCLREMLKQALVNRSVVVAKDALRKNLPDKLKEHHVQRVLLLTSVEGHERIGRFLTWLCQSQSIQVVPYAMARGDIAALKFVEEAMVVTSRTGCQGIIAAGGPAVMDVGKLSAVCQSDDTLFSDLTKVYIFRNL